MRARCLHLKLALMLMVMVNTACQNEEAFTSDPNSSSHSSQHDHAPTEPLQTDPSESSRDSTSSIDEPIAVGGAFLTCSAPTEQNQLGDSWQLSCALNDAEALKGSESITGAFTWVDSKGAEYPLVVAAFEADRLRWQLLADRAWPRAVRIEASISLDSQSPIGFDTEFSLPEQMSFALNVNYWLSGEPNNLSTQGGVTEDCSEFGNSEYRLDHMQRTSLDSEPQARLNDALCSLELNVLCRNIEPSSDAAKWVLSEAEVNFEQASMACPQSYQFSLPLSPAEWTEVTNLVDESDEVFSVWIALDDRQSEGMFTSNFKFSD